MLAISQAISREFAPRFTRSDAAGQKSMSFSGQELLAISQEISREFSPRPVENRSELVLLPIDPGRLHAYWHLAEPRSNTGLNAEPKPVDDEPKTVAEEQLTLRIYKRSSPAAETADKAEQPSWFDIPVGDKQSRREVILPPDNEGVAGTSYYAAIGICHGGEDFSVFAVSNAADVPNPRQRQDNSGLSDVITQFNLPTSTVSSPISQTNAHQEIRGSR